MAAPLRSRAFVTALALMAVVPQACDAPRIDSPATPVPTFGKTAGGPSVTAANPASGHQGDVTLDVTITGSGFDTTSRASWQRNGVPDPKITVNRTRFNSASSLTANITIAPDAVVTTYDIAVTLSTGKKGIGAELFTVTYAVAISGVTEGRAISDSGVVAGANGTAVVSWSPSSGLATVATNGVVWDIDRAGHTIGGKDAADKATIWTSPSGLPGSWVATRLTDLGSPTGSAVRGIASDASGNAVMLTGNAYSLDGRKNALVWTRTTNGWSERVYDRPTGLTGAWGQAINRRGQVVGMDGSGCCSAVYWDSLGAATRLPFVSGTSNAAAYSINGDGTLVVGNSGSTAVMWRRSLAGVDGYGPWSVVALDNPTSLCGKTGTSIAYDVNPAGTIVVGASCGVAVAWTLSGASVTRVVLQGLGPPNHGAVYGINDAAAPRATGFASSSQGVYWWGF